ncbi:alpha-L-rhamnosidase C-terminal domain-containing protein [Coraliomargarita sp. SDUM461003]|uniref:Alpha-L-rhamnosidase C-terminal domain-containing protein n=1 Tax=Thalassobacterium maritimum TaxID=3041265 RepID=A0ABU1AWC9_9BACT|nr:alpha-L-rhamnosidase C-terminal domain-containing protein [Coraliomargarita sp. SDUM461003]MDQ8208452.1 alpha-L-rhamnosidase C-terminal domain-containing protein [Coraliomargarita sp. SDUM461003]
MQNLPTNRLPRILQQAKWIWPDSPHWDLRNCYALFRKEFQLPQVPPKALLYITADQSYQLYINGAYIGRGPARGFQETWPYDTIEVSKWLTPGKNLIAIRAHTPGFSNFQYIHKGYAGLLVAAQWGDTNLLSNATWTCRRQSGLDRSMVQTSLQLFPQEKIDLRQEDPDWMQPNYDDTHWEGRPVELALGCLPWTSLEERDIPLLDERILRVGQIIGKAKGKNHEEYLQTRNLSITHFQEGLTHKASQASIADIHFEGTGRGQWRSVLIDLGKTYVGSTIIEIESAKGGEIIETHHYETIDAAKLCPDYKPKAHCRMAFSNRLTCGKGKQSHAFYHSFGFRYMILLVRDSDSDLTLHPRLRTATYPHKIEGTFQSSDATLNEIWNICAWTQQICSLDAYVDTPYREQAQWWGDARVQAWNTFHLSGDPRLLKRGIRQIATQTTPDGVTYGHAPTMAHGCILPDFTLIWILTLWDDYWQTGSLQSFEQHQPTIRKALHYFEEWTDLNNGLLQYDHRYWLFLDWTGLHKQGCSSVYSLWYLHALDRLSQMYALSKDASSSQACQLKAKRLRRQLQKLINEEGLMQGGYDENGKLVKETSIHAQTLCLLTDLASAKQEREMIEMRLLPFVRGELKTDSAPSAYWTTYVYTVLSERGYGAEVLADIRKHWKPMIPHGTTWEKFDPIIAKDSFSHAWAAHPLYHCMQIIGGVRQTAPEWSEVSIQPTFHGDSAEICIPSPKGKIRSKWKRTNDRIVGKVTLPKGVVARLILPNQNPIKISDLHTYECF